MNDPVKVQQLVTALSLEFLASNPLSGPIAGPFLRVIEKYANDAKFTAIGDDIRNLKAQLEAMSTSKFGNVFLGYEPKNSETAMAFRNAKSTLILVKYLSEKSLHGLGNDPILDSVVGSQLLEDAGISDATTAWRMSVHELEKLDLIYRQPMMNNEPEYIAPKPFFFSRTDALFQPWNLADDAKRAIQFTSEREGRQALHQDVMERFRWDSRRMNAVLKFMEGRGLIFELNGCHENLWDWYFRLTDEADFFLAEN